jgi:hypothetical protein
LKNTVVILDQASGYLQIDMLEALSLRYDKCVIIAGTIIERETKLPDNVVWHKVIKYKKTSFPKRIITWLLCSFQMYWIIITKYRKARVIAITNPPLTPFICLLARVHFDVLIYDLYPDTFVNYKIISWKNPVTKFWVYLTKSALSKANRVLTITQGLAKEIEKYTDKKIEIVPIWTNNQFFSKIEKNQNLFLNNHPDLKDKFIVSYSGNLGKTHPIEKILDLADRFRQHNLIEFVIIGGGYKFELIQNEIILRKLPNVKLLPWQDIELLPHVLQAADVNVVTLDTDAANLSIPSKTFNLFSSGRPIMAICSSNSSLSILLNETKSGRAFNDAQIDEMSLFITDLKDSKELQNEFASNALLASELFTKKNAKLFI